MTYTKLSRAAQNAIAKHTPAGVVRAYVLNRHYGEGASSIALQYNVPNVRTTRQADAAINAGEELYNLYRDAQGTPAYRAVVAAFGELNIA